MVISFKDITGGLLVDQQKELRIISEAIRPDQIKQLQELIKYSLSGPKYEADEKFADFQITGEFDKLTKKYLKEYLQDNFEIGSEKFTKEEAIGSLIDNLDSKIGARQETIAGSIEDKVMDQLQMED